jgi:hypothetical protein
MRRRVRFNLLASCSVVALLLAVAVAVRPTLGWQFDRVVGPPVPHSVNQLLASQRTAPTIRFLGFHETTYFMWYGGPSMHLVRRLTIPAWPLALIGLTMPIKWSLGSIIGLRARRAAKCRERGVCPCCGYDVRVTPDRCPECGWTTTSADAPHNQPMQRAEAAGRVTVVRKLSEGGSGR